MNQEHNIQQYHTHGIHQLNDAYQMTEEPYVAPTPIVPDLQETDPDWKQVSQVRDTTAARVRAAKPYIAPPVNPADAFGELAKQYNLEQQARNEAQKKELSAKRSPAKKLNVFDNFGYSYGYSGIDQSTLDAFGDLNLNLATMTWDDRKKVYAHPMLSEDEKAMPLADAVAILKVKLLDHRDALINVRGKRRVDYEDIPAPADSPWAPKVVQPEKKGLLKKATSAVSGALKKLKFW